MLQFASIWNFYLIVGDFFFLKLGGDDSDRTDGSTNMYINII